MAITKRALTERGFVKINLVERGPVPSRMRKSHTAAAKVAWRDAAKHHHVHNTPSRFTEAGGKRLGFRERDPKYVERKFRTWGHRDPNVWTGRSKRRAKMGRITSVSKGAKIRYNVQQLNFHSGAKELRTVVKPEAEGIAEAWTKTYEKEIEKA